MKFLLILFIALLPSMALAQTGTKFTEYPADTSPTADDLILTTNDPAGTPASRKVTISDLATALSSIMAITGDHGTLTGLADDDHPQYSLIKLSAGTPGSSACTTDREIWIDTTNDILFFCPDGAGSQPQRAYAKAPSYTIISSNSGSALLTNDEGAATLNIVGSDNISCTAANGSPDSVTCKMSVASQAQGDVIYYNGTNWVRLAPGTSGHYLQTQGTAANPQWAAAAGGGAAIKNLCRWDAKQGHPPASLFAPLDTMAGASTPAEVIPVLNFDPSTVWYMDFRCQIPAHYAGGGYTLHIYHSNTTATLETIFSGGFRRVSLNAENLTAAHTYDFNNSSAITVPSTIGQVARTQITFTDGVDADSATANDYIILRIRRFATDAGDDNTGVSQVHLVVLDES